VSFRLSVELTHIDWRTQNLFKLGCERKCTQPTQMRRILSVLGALSMCSCPTVSIAVDSGTAGGSPSAGGGSAGGGSAGGGTAMATGGGSDAGVLPANDVLSFWTAYLTEVCRLQNTCAPGMRQGSACSSEAAVYAAIVVRDTGSGSSLVKYNAMLGNQCLAYARTVTCLTSDYALSYFNGPCDPSTVLQGLVPLNGTCSTGLECQTPYTCRSGAMCGASTCGEPGASPQPIAIGGACTSRTACAKGAYCNAQSQRCTAIPTIRIAAGQACTADDSMWCELGTTCIDGQCSRPRPGGANCLADKQCLSSSCATAAICRASFEAQAGELCKQRNCASGLYCDDLGGFVEICKMTLGAGVACNTSRQCSTGLFCTGSFTVPGVCAAPRDLDQPCTLNGAFNQCKTPLYCASTLKCAARSLPGVACTLNSECESGLYCTAFPPKQTQGVCAAPSPVGQPCYLGRASNQCAPSLFCSAEIANDLNNPGGQCAARKPVGETCTSYRECTGACQNGTCSGCPVP
jgi:hypothetical protein